MSYYDKRTLWDPKQKDRLSRIQNILEGPIIRGVKNILTQEEKMHQSKPKNRQEYERQFTNNKKNKEWKNNW